MNRVKSLIHAILFSNSFKRKQLHLSDGWIRASSDENRPSESRVLSGLHYPKEEGEGRKEGEGGEINPKMTYYRLTLLSWEHGFQVSYWPL